MTTGRHIHLLGQSNEYATLFVHNGIVVLVNCRQRSPPCFFGVQMQCSVPSWRQKSSLELMLWPGSLENHRDPLALLYDDRPKYCDFFSGKNEQMKPLGCSGGLRQPGKRAPQKCWSGAPLVEEDPWTAEAPISLILVV